MNLYKVYAQIKIDPKNEADALTLFALKRLCDRDIDDPKYNGKVTAIGLGEYRLIVLKDGYELDGP